jgi:DNA-binding winged helix-turn-helix (wHTH) protein/Tol biopolymer transport system component
LHQTARNEPTRIRFGVFELDGAEGQLYKRGVPLHMENHPFLVLAALLERPGEIVTREQLRQRIWRDGTNVGFEDGLNTAVRKLRSALGDSSDSPLFIETVPRKGYRFVAPLNGGIGDLGTHPEKSAQIAPLKLVGEIKPARNPSQDLTQLPTHNVLSVRSRDRFELLAVVVVLVIVIAGVILLGYSRWQRPASNVSVIQEKKLEGAHTMLAAALSQDGRYVAYAPFDGLTSSVRLRQVANTGDVEILSPRKTYYVGLTFSPDGSELYLVRADEDNPGYRSLYRMPILGGQVRKLIADVDSPVSFSPDGRRFVFARFHSAALTLEVRTANADGSGEELLTQFPKYAWCPNSAYATWSPDGRTIAVPFQGTLTTDRSSLYAVDVATRRAEEIYSANGGSCIGRPMWMPDKALIFSRDGDLWMVKDRLNGARLVMDHGVNQVLDLSRDGKTAIAIDYHYSYGLWVVPMQQLSAARQIISGDAPLRTAEELIDGRILVTKEDGSVWTTNASGSDWQGLANVRGYAVSCGQYIVVRTADGGSLVRSNEDGTGVKTLVRGPTKILACSPTGDAVFYTTPDQPQQIMRVSTDSGESVAVVRVQGGAWASALSVSPDGNFLAYSFVEGSQPKTGFAVLRASDGSLVKLIDGARLGTLDVHWAHDSRALHYVSAVDKWADVWEQPLAGGKPRRITRFGSGSMRDFHWTRDGKRLLVVRGRSSDDLVLLSGLR